MPAIGEALGGEYDGTTILIVRPGEVISIKWLVENSPSDKMMIGLQKDDDDA